MHVGATINTLKLKQHKKNGSGPDKCPHQIFLPCTTGYYRKYMKNLTEHSTYQLVTFKSNIVR